MAEIRPFKGLLYNKTKVGGDYSAVMAPPYDVISQKERDELYNKNDHNIIRLILGKDLESDTPQDNKYTRAKNSLKDWIKEDILVRDDADAFYVYLQEYSVKGKKHRRIGFLGLIKIEGDDIVLPHEHTLAKPKEDRMNLIKEVKSNLSPIFTLYDDEDGSISLELENTVSGGDPAIDITLGSETHKLWKLQDTGAIEKIVSGMSDKKVFIADGHHRYSVARSYRDFRRSEADYDGTADYILMYFSDMSDSDNLTIFPTHRVIKEMPVADESIIKEKLTGYFNITEHDNLSGLMKTLEEDTLEEHVFGFFGGNKFLLLKPKSAESLRALIKEEKTDEWKKLDVSVLHLAVLEGILSVPSKEGNITYVKDPAEGEELVKGKSHMAAFFLKPTRVEQMKAVAECGEMMPQKSTYFYPKLLTGLVISRFRNQKAKVN